MDPQLVVYGALLGIVYGLYGLLTKREKDEPVSLKKLLRTTLVWGVAGAIVATTDTPLTHVGIAEQVSQVVVLGVVFDMAWNRVVGGTIVRFRGDTTEG